jgi:hypothetical protein
MSLSEFERWFAILCVEVYHQKRHSQLGMPPIAKWQEGVFGVGKKPGIGVPPRITDELRLKLDLMPFETRTVQQYGIVWDHIEYQHDVLRRWSNAPDPDKPRLKRKFLCRRDPRDISTIWFYDPEVQQYYAIPYRNTSHPAISIWELREAERRVTEERRDIPVDEGSIFDAYDKMRRIEEDAKKLTKKVRRGNERRRLGLANARSHVEAVPAPPEASVPEARPQSRDIQPFDEVDDIPRSPVSEAEKQRGAALGVAHRQRRGLAPRLRCAVLSRVSGQGRRAVLPQAVAAGALHVLPGSRLPAVRRMSSLRSARRVLPTRLWEGTQPDEGDRLLLEVRVRLPEGRTDAGDVSD